ncbi:membrane protein [soil metagenome]
MPSTPERPLRVPHPTAMFWGLKLLTTGVGEVASDFLVKTFDPVPVVLLAAVGFAAIAVLQLTARRYVPWRYWAFVLAVAVFGTMIADVAHLVIGIPYAISTPLFALVLAAVFVAWRRTEGTLAVHSVDTQRRELFYWSTVIATFALGTAFGDLTATTLGLGYFGSILLFAALFVVPVVLFRAGLPATAAFWWAYVLTRPLGASIADWLALPPARGGLDLGYAAITSVGLAFIGIGVAVVQRRSLRQSGRVIPTSEEVTP